MADAKTPLDAAAKKTARTPLKKYDTAKYRVNAVNGCHIPGPLGMQPQNAEITVSYFTEPRNSWFPLDDAAHQRFAHFNQDLMDAKIDYIEVDIGNRIAQGKIKDDDGAVAFRKKYMRAPKPLIANAGIRPTNKIQELEAELERLKAEDQEIVANRIKNDVQAPPSLSVRASDS